MNLLWALINYIDKQQCVNRSLLAAVQGHQAVLEAQDQRLAALEEQQKQASTLTPGQRTGAHSDRAIGTSSDNIRGT